MFLTICVVSYRSHATLCFSMSAREDIVSTSTTSRGKKGGRKGASVGCTWMECPTKLISEREFRGCFHILNKIFVLLADDDPTPTEKQSHNAIYFSNE